MAGFSPGCRSLCQWMSMDAKSAVELMESSNEVNFSGFHMVGFEQRKDSIEQPTTSETDMYKQPFVIGVAGGAASGKTAVCDMIIQQLHDQRVVLVNQVFNYFCLYFSIIKLKKYIKGIIENKQSIVSTSGPICILFYP